MRRLLALPLVAVGLALAAVQAAAAAPDLVAARLQGPWNLLVTTASYTGAPPGPNARPVGHQAIDAVWFQSACQAPGSCMVRIYGPQGPGQANFFQYYSNTSGFEGPSVDQGLTQSGTTYSIPQIPTGGFGGRITCSPPPPPRPTQTLSLRVTDAKQSGGAWLATTIVGTETLNGGWACNGTQTVGWTAVHLTILGHPVGYVLPKPVQPPSLTVSSLASALNPPGQAFRTPLLIVANLVITALVILFVTFPAALFNHTLSENYEEISAVARPLRPLRDLLTKRTSRRRADAMVFGGTLLAGAWLNGQLDPRFAFDARSLTSYLATVVTICFGVGMSALVALLYRRARGRDTQWTPHALPLGLVVAAACVLISRATGFAPGYFYGLVAGVAFGTALAKHEAGHTAALASLTTMTLAVLAWFGWAAVNPAAQTGGAWPVVLVDDFLGSVFVGGLVGNVVGLLPLRSLLGGTLIDWHRGVWGAIFGVAVFGLVQVLLHPEQGAVHPSGAPLVTAIILFLGFGGGSVAFNRYFAWDARPTKARPAEAAAPA